MVILKILAMIMLVALTFGAGLAVDREELKTVLKDFGLLGRALLANVVIVPALGWIFANTLKLPIYVATGYLLMAISPGVPFVLFRIRRKGGSMGLAVVLTIILPLVSIVTIPLTAPLVMPAGITAQLPLSGVLTTLVLFQLLPLAVGMLLADPLRVAAPRLEPLLKIVVYVCVILFFILVAPKMAASVALIFGSRGIFAMLLLDICAMVTGMLLGGRARENRRVLGPATALRNIGFCMTIAATDFPNTIAIEAILTYLLVQIIVGGAFAIYFARTAQPVTA